MLDAVQSLLDNVDFLLTKTFSAKCPAYKTRQTYYCVDMRTRWRAPEWLWPNPVVMQVCCVAWQLEHGVFLSHFTFLLRQGSHCQELAFRRGIGRGQDSIPQRAWLRLCPLLPT
jgi:hypothetical protein